jgi:hypothetical protein
MAAAFASKTSTQEVKRRALFLFPILFITLFAVIVVTIYYGNKTGELEKQVLAPLRNSYSTFVASMQEHPKPSVTEVLPTIVDQPLQSSAPTPSAVTSSKPAAQRSVVVSTPAPQPCIRDNIREGEFASNKCYTQQDYNDLEYYLSKYSSAKWNIDFYDSKVKIVCSNVEFYGNQCENTKKEQEENKTNVDKYRSIIQTIIARGK